MVVLMNNWSSIVAQSGVKVARSIKPFLAKILSNFVYCFLFVAMQPSAAMSATPRKANKDSPELKDALTTQATLVSQLMTIIQPSALLLMRNNSL